MKRLFYRILLSAFLLAAIVTGSQAANGYIDTLHYTMCPGDTLTLETTHRVEVTRDCIIFDTILVAEPTMDSIHMYVVNLYPAYRFVQRKEIIPGQAFNWCGETIQEAGTYTKVYKSQHGCDSTQILVVTQREGMEMELRSQQVIPFCDSVAWNGIIYRESAVLTDTLLSTVYGCDSIVTTILTKGIPFRHYETDSLFIGETLSWHGLTINEAGEYYDEHTNHFGCDSTYVLRVVLKASAPQPKVSSTRMTICEGDAFPWRGESHTLSGTYYDTVFNGSEIDTLHVLYLTVNPRYEYSETVSFSTFPTLYRGQSIPAPGTYPITYTSSGGCDSVINVIVNRQVIIHEESATICKGEVYEWRFKRLTEAQDYIETIKGKDGKDSVTYILHLSVHEIPETRVTRTICHGDSYVFGTQILTEAGEYRHTFKQDGCDSTVVLSLNIADVDTIVQVHRLNPGESYTWPANGHTYSTAGTYQVTNTNRFGCDSITRLVLTINHVDTIDSVATICPGETLVWHSISACQTGHYENVETGVHGDMRYYRLDLTVREQKEVEVSFTICGDESIGFNGKTYSKAGHYYDKGACDTLYHIIVSQTPTQVYETNAKLDGVHPYTWTYWENGTEHTDNFSTPGTYEYTSPNTTTGCNDIWRLVLSLDNNTYHFVEQVSLCEGETFSWRGHDDLSLVPGTAVYTEHLYTRTGNDSIYELQVTVRPLGHSYRTINFCGSTEWKGTTYSSSTIVYDTLTAANGCDSIVEISLRKSEGFFRRDTATIVQGEKLLWHGQTITTDGVYEDRQVTAFGCDSIYELHVGIKAATPQTNMITEIAEICEGDYYEWRGHKYYNKGLYPDTVFATTIDEQDTIFVLNLNVIEQERRREQYFFCENEKLERIYGEDYNAKVRTDSVYRDTVAVANRQPYIWRGQNLTHTGIYRDTLTASTGCDSIYQLVLTIYDKEVLRDTVIRACETDLPIRWKNRWISETGIIYDTITTHDVDTIWRVDVRIVPMEYETIEKTLCEGDSYSFNGHNFTRDTLLHDTIYTGLGCGKEYTVFLRFRKVQTVDYYAQTPSNEAYIWNIDGTTYSYRYNGNYEHVIRTADDACDSIRYVLHLTVGAVYEFRDSTKLCQSELPYLWHNQMIYDAGIYYDSLQTVMGYDSVYILKVLEIMPAYYAEQNIDLCDGSTAFYYRSKPYSKAGIFYDTIPSINGCDSIVHMDLTVYPTYQFYTDAIIADYQTYEWRGREYDVTGNYDITYPTINDCDSTYTLRLKVVETAIYNTYDTICEGGTYRWRGVDYSQDGIYTDTVYKPQSSSSAIYTLYLTVLHPTNITSATVQDICADARTFDITFTYTGAQPTAYSIYFDQLAKDEGFKDVINQQLYGETRIASAPLPEKPEVVYLEHTKYVKPNTYTMSLVLDNGICGKSSVDSIALKIKYPNWIIEQNWNDIVVPLKQKLNGGYEFSQVDWYVNEVRQINNGKGYLQYNFRDGDQVVMSATRKGENYAIETCPLTIHINSNIAYDEPVLVYPTQTPRYMPKVTVESPRDGQYEIFNSTGLIINSGELHEGQTDLMLPGTCGIYFIRVLQGDQVSSHKVLVY